MVGTKATNTLIIYPRFIFDKYFATAEYLLIYTAGMLPLVHMAHKPDFSKKILASLSGRQAVRVSEIQEDIAGSGAKKVPAKAYAVTRSIRNLSETGYIETLDSEHSEFARLTQKGRQKLASLKLDSKNSLANPNWDGKWRIVLLDLPEERKAERESLRYLLKKAGFTRLKNSAWVSPFPFEFLFQNLKKDFGLSSELMIIVTDTIDPETEAALRAAYDM